MEIQVKEIIEQGLYQDTNIEKNQLAKYLGIKYCNFTENDINYIDMFWEPAFNDSWILVTEELVSEHLGYKLAKDMMTNFIKQQLLKNYEVNVEYQEILKDHELVKKSLQLNLTSKDSRGGVNKKYYMIKGEIFSDLMQRAGTSKGKENRKMFRKCLNLVKYMDTILMECAKYIFNIKLQEKDLAIQTKDLVIQESKLAIQAKEQTIQASQKQIEENEKLLEKTKKETERTKAIMSEAIELFERTTKEGKIYLGATFSDILKLIIKLSMTVDADKRNSNHNCSPSILDEFKMYHIYPVHMDLMYSTEQLLQKMLDPLNLRKRQVRKGNKEHFWVPTELADYATRYLLSAEDHIVELVNKLVRILKENSLDMECNDVNDFIQHLKDIDNLPIQSVLITDPIVETSILEVLPVQEVIPNPESLPELVESLEQKEPQANQQELQNPEQLLKPAEEIALITNLNLKKKMTKRNEVIKHANEQEFKVVSEYINCLLPLTLKCSRNHIHEYKVAKIISKNLVCPDCIEINTLNAKLNVKGIKCLDFENKKFKCFSNNHEFIVTDLAYFDKVLKNANTPYCLKCKGQQKFTTADYHKVATENGGQWIGEIVSSVNIPTNWKCKNDHIFTDSYVTARDFWKNRCKSCNPKLIDKFNIAISKYKTAQVSNTDITSSNISRDTAIFIKCKHNQVEWKTSVRQIVEGAWVCSKCKKELIK